MFSLAAAEELLHCLSFPEAVSLSAQGLDEGSCITFYQREAQMPKYTLVFGCFFFLKYHCVQS